jgi:hypothetical protein
MLYIKPARMLLMIKGTTARLAAWSFENYSQSETRKATERARKVLRIAF